VDEMIPDFPAGAAITMSLWAKRSACSGTMPSGQWMCAERHWMSSMIDMIVPSIRPAASGTTRISVTPACNTSRFRRR
jgi:hypothetical protein